MSETQVLSGHDVYPHRYKRMRMADRIDYFVHDYPYTSILLALGVGCLVGVLFAGGDEPEDVAVVPVVPVRRRSSAAEH
ncbi:MAG TPA: hypothetical protein VKC60_10460 [Opitutaceae bacterium]|nr:hypothetical protein [Opitutaceae bacterium]